MAVPAFAVAPCECVPGKPTAESYTWNFHREANQLIKEIRNDSAAASRHAATLQSFADSPELSWQADAAQLANLKTEIDGMGRKLCRLETIHNAVAPWQQKAINRVKRDVVLMANNAEDAISFVNNHRQYLWSPVYKNYTDNLYNLSANLKNTTDNAVEYAHARAKDRELHRSMQMSSSS